MIYTGYLPNTGMKANSAKPALLGHTALLFLGYQGHMINVNKILKCPLGLMQWEESDFSMTAEAGF